MHPEGSLVWTKSYQGCEEVQKRGLAGQAQKRGLAGQVLLLSTLTFPGGRHTFSAV